MKKKLYIEGNKEWLAWYNVLDYKTFDMDPTLVFPFADFKEFLKNNL